MSDHKIVSREEWTAAREELLAREKEHTRLGDELARQRRELPWVLVEKEYRFDTDDGPRTLAQLFDGRSQLLVYHFMFGADYTAGCTTCSSIADGVNGVVPHLNARDVTMLFVSQAPLEKLQAYKRDQPGLLAPRFEVEEQGEQRGRDEAERGIGKRPAKPNQDRAAVHGMTHETEDPALPQTRAGARSWQRREQRPSESTPRTTRSTPATAISNPRMPRNESADPGQ
jgi:hypothetical protein